MGDLITEDLDEISIDPGTKTIHVQYSWYEFGGARDFIRYIISVDPTVPPAHARRTAQRGVLHRQDVSWIEVPQRVFRDLLPWLAEERRKAQASGKKAIDSLMGDLEQSVGRGARLSRPRSPEP